MMILAIDPSLTSTAAFIGRDSLDWKRNCFYSQNVGDDAWHRVSRYNDLVARIAGWVDPIMPSAVYIEAYSFGSNDARSKFSAEYGGLLRAYLATLTDRIFEVAPTTLKKFCTGKGAGKKEMVIGHLMKNYGVEFGSNDEFDAYGLYRLGLVAEGICGPANQAQREAADTVLGIKTTKKKGKVKQ